MAKPSKSGECSEIEYSIEAKQNCESSDISVLGKQKRPYRYNLKTLIESNNPQHKQILKSSVINTVENDSRNSFKCLLYKNYQISPLNDKNQTALHLAYYKQSNGIISEFNDYLGSKNCQQLDQTDYKDINGLTHLHIACASGSIKFVDKYSKNSANINTHFVINNESQKECNGFTPLHFATINFKYHNKKMMEMLIERGADVNSVDTLGRTPLHLICCSSSSVSFGKDSLEVMKVLIDHQANVNAKDVFGCTPIFKVFSLLNDKRKYSKDKTLEEYTTEMELKLTLLVKRADVNVKNSNNDTVFHEAVNFLRILSQIYRDGEFEDSKNVQLLELMMTAKKKCCLEIDINVENNDGQTPLILAISHLSVDMVKFFLKHNADLTNLNFNNKNDEFFQYSNYIYKSTFKYLDNLVVILMLLWNEGCVLKPKDNLTVLKFLLHEIKHFWLRDYNFKSDIFHIMCCEHSSGLESRLREFYWDFSNDYMRYMANSEEYLDYFDDLRAYLFCINKAKVFVNENSKILIKNALDKCIEIRKYEPGFDTISEEIYEELETLEIFSINGKNIFEILRDKAEDTAVYFNKGTVDKSCLNGLNYFKGIISGHFNIGMIRCHVVKLAYNCVIQLHSSPLPYLCYEQITDYLSNNDILNVCLAVVK